MDAPDLDRVEDVAADAKDWPDGRSRGWRRRGFRWDGCAYGGRRRWGLQGWLVTTTADESQQEEAGGATDISGSAAAAA